jgi:hypothetical protein
MEEKNKKILLIVGSILVIIILAAVVYFLFFFKWPGVSPLNVLVNNAKIVNKIVKENLPAGGGSPTEKEAKIVADQNSPAPSSEEMERYTAGKIASSFAERFGSYSNQSDYGNINDLRGFMTEKMLAWADKYVVDAHEKNSYNGIYQGTITRAISSEVKKFDSAAGSAEILVSTQRSDSSGDSNDSKVYYEDIVIKMVKESGSWKIDSAFWQGRN